MLLAKNQQLHHDLELLLVDFHCTMEEHSHFIHQLQQQHQPDLPQVSPNVNNLGFHPPNNDIGTLGFGHFHQSPYIYHSH